MQGHKLIILRMRNKLKVYVLIDETLQPLPLSNSQNIGSQTYSFRQEIKIPVLGARLQKKVLQVYLEGPPTRKFSVNNPIN